MKNVLRTLVYNGQVSLTIIDTTEIVQKSIQLHKLSRASAYLFGKAISIMTFMSACLKEDVGEISLSLQTDGDCSEIAVSGNRALRMRGYIGNTQLTGEGNGESERLALGKNGALTIIRDDGYNRPFIGACALQTQGIDEAFEEYFRISEQLPTFIASQVQCTGEDCDFAGVAVLQPLPFADENTLEKVRNFDLHALLQEMKTKEIQTLVKERFDVEESVWEVRSAVYKCNCSKRYLMRVLVSLGEEQLRAIIKEDGVARIHCHYCNTDYEFTEKDADELFS